jgi:SulP family sulfate permease
LTGVLQIAAGYLRLGALMRFVSRSVVTGFVNALAILIFLAQLPELTHVGWEVYAMTAAGLGIIYLFPLLPVVGRLLPSPLVCILVLTRRLPWPWAWTFARWATWVSCPIPCRYCSGRRCP